MRRTHETHEQAGKYLGGIPELIARTKTVVAEPPRIWCRPGSLPAASQRSCWRHQARCERSRPVARRDSSRGTRSTGVACRSAVQVHFATADPYREQPELDAFERAVLASGRRSAEIHVRAQNRVGRHVPPFSSSEAGSA
jgi:hypothetical protein